MAIYIKNIRDAKSDETVWAIVRSIKNCTSNMIQVQDLSPSKELFYDYLKWKRYGTWNINKFNDEYVRRFISEIKSNDRAIMLLDMLMNIGAHSDVTLVCFCKDESMCHRSIIAGILQGFGADVVAGGDYSEYYSRFMLGY